MTDHNLCSASLEAAQAEGVLAKAAEHSGYSAIRTAEISFVVTIGDAPPTPEKLDAAVHRQEVALQQQIDKNQNNPTLVGIFEKALKNNRENVIQQVIANAKRTISGIYLIGGPPIGGDQLVEFRVRRGYEAEWGPQVTLLIRRLSPQQQTSLIFETAAHVAVATNKSAVAGFRDPQVLGRLQGAVLTYFQRRKVDPGDAADLKFALTQKSADFGENSLTVEVFAPPRSENRRIATIVVDPSRDYICPLIEEYGDTGKIRARWKSENYFQDTASGIWFPERCTYVAAEDGQKRTLEYTFDRYTTSFNKELPPERFACVLPPHTDVVSQLGMAEEQYQTTKQVSLTIDDLDSLPGRTDLMKPSVVAIPKTHVLTPTRQTRGVSKKWLVLGNVIILVAAALYFYNRRRRRHTILIVIAAYCIASGCTKRSEIVNRHNGPTGDENRSRHAFLVVVPTEFDFGIRAADGQGLESSLELSNVASSGEMSIHLTAGCGCTYLGNTEIHLRAREKAIVSFAISTAGRNGDFRTTITVVSSIELPEGVAEQKAVIPLTAKFVKSIFALPSRVVLAPSEDGRYSGVVTIAAPSDLWEKMVVSGENDKVSVRSIGDTATTHFEERRRFRIDVPSTPGLQDFDIFVGRMQPKQTVLKIPVLIGTRSGTVAGKSRYSKQSTAAESPSNATSTTVLSP